MVKTKEENYKEPKVAACRAKRKKEVNEYFAEKCLPKHQILFLEGEGLKTTIALKKQKHSKSRMHIPNNTESYYKIKECVKNTYKMPLSKFLKYYAKVIVGRLKSSDLLFKFGGAYLDFCEGLNTEAQDSIKKLFVNKLLADNVPLGITHSMRTSVKNYSGYSTRLMLKVINYVQHIAEENGYKATVQYDVGGSYRYEGNPMFTIWFIVVKR